jgi:hypothetical protein
LFSLYHYQLFLLVLFVGNHIIVES